MLIASIGFTACQDKAEDPKNEEHVQQMDSIRNEIEIAGDSLEKKTDHLEASIDEID